MREQIHFIRLMLGAAMVAGVAATGVPSANATGKAGLLKPDVAGVVEAGRAVYGEHCAACHGANLEGEGDWRRRKPDGKLPAPPHDITGHTWHHADKILFEITKFGLKKFAGDNYESDMPVYDGVLSDDEIIAVLSFIKSHWPDHIREHHDKLNEAAAKSGQ